MRKIGPCAGKALLSHVQHLPRAPQNDPHAPPLSPRSVVFRVEIGSRRWSGARRAPLRSGQRSPPHPQCPAPPGSPVSQDMTATQPALRNPGIMPISTTPENAGRIKSAWEDCFCHPGVSRRDGRLRSGGGGRQASTRLHEPISTRNSTDLGEGRLTDPSPRHRAAPPPARAEPQSPARRLRHWPRALTTLLCPLLYEEKERSKEQGSVVSAGWDPPPRLTHV